MEKNKTSAVRLFQRSMLGQGMVEYGLLLVLVTVGLVVVLQLFGISVRDVYCDAATAFKGESACNEREECVDEFASAGNAWENRSGKWRVKNDQMCTANTALSFNACSLQTNKKDYTVKLDSAELAKGNGYGVFFRVTRPDGAYNGYTFQYDPGYAGGAYIFRKWVNGRELSPFAVNRAPGKQWHNSPHDVEVVVDGDTFTAYVDGEAVLTGVDDTYAEGGVGLRSWDSTRVCFERFALGEVNR